MRRRLILIAGVSLLPVTFLMLWIAQPDDPINEDNFNRIAQGMTEIQVEQTLGGPANSDSVGGNDWITKSWEGRGGRAILVNFSTPDYVVRWAQFVDPSP